jgi:hypothetical protein
MVDHGLVINPEQERPSQWTIHGQRVVADTRRAV